MMDFIASRLLPALLNMSLTASVVILAVLLARLVLRGAPKVYSYALWAVVLFRLLCPVSVTTGFSLLELVDPPVSQATLHTNTVEYVQPNLQAAGMTQAPLPTEGSGQAVQAPAPVQPAAAPDTPFHLASYVWLGGILALLLYSLVSLLLLRRRLIGAARLRGNIYLADHIRSPFVMGLLRPRIYLPSSLPEPEQRYILLHEQYHIRRLDHIIKLLAFAALCLHWFNPLVWAAFVLANKDMEMSCDEAVVKQLGEGIRADYSASLLSLATGRRIIAGMPLAFGEGDTKARIKNLLHWKRPRLWLSLTAAAACAAVIAACASNPQSGAAEPPAPDSPEMTGRYSSMEDFAQQTMEHISSVNYVSARDGSAIANVTATKLDYLNKEGELDGLALEGTLELWTFRCFVQTDADPDDIMLVGGMSEVDGWYDLEGQGGHVIVSLRYEDGSYDVLYDDFYNDGMDFFGYHNSNEEAIYDWYVQEYGLDLPLYVEEWSDRFEIGDNLPVHRFDGDGWYLYLPVSAWSWLTRNGAGNYECQSLYNTGSSLILSKSADSVEAVKEGDLAQGRAIAGSEHAAYMATVQRGDETDAAYLYEAEDGGCYVLHTIWHASGITDYPYIAIEPDVLAAIAESFTVDRRFAQPAAPAPTGSVQSPAQVLQTVQNGDPLQLTLIREDGVLASYAECWDVSNAASYFNGLNNCTWEEVSPDSVSLEAVRDAVQLSELNGWSLTAYDAASYVYFAGSEGDGWFRTAQNESVYQALRGWLNEIEYAALNGDYEHQNLVVADVGQDYLAAAAEYVQAFEGIHLQAAAGSKFCYTFVKTSVEAAQGATEMMRERREIGENSFCFYLTTVFVPENEAALDWSMAGNTGDYTGSDPDVPEGALEYYRCGYITRENDGWHGTLIGTGW